MSVFQPGLFAGKSVFITGGSSGIGLGVAEAFGVAGAKVAINGRNAEKLERAVSQLTSKGITAQGYAADVRQFAAIEAALEQAKAAHGPQSDIAQMAMFLASEAASFVTGAIISVDGGMTLVGGSMLGAL